MRFVAMILLAISVLCITSCSDTRKVFDSVGDARNALNGKTTKEIIEMLGKPDIVYGGGSLTGPTGPVGYEDSWGYWLSVKHEKAGVLQQLRVFIDNDKVFYVRAG